MKLLHASASKLTLVNTGAKLTEVPYWDALLISKNLPCGVGSCSVCFGSCVDGSVERGELLHASVSKVTLVRADAKLTEVPYWDA